MRLSDLVGQTRATTVLRQAIRRGHVAHAYLFRGPAGVGKSTAAHLFAQALNCDAPDRNESGEPCGECRACQMIAAGSHPDVWEVTLLREKGKLRTEISINQIRRNPKDPGKSPRPVVQDAILRPVLGRHKVYIIGPAEKMSDEAQNALLKVLEEPPPYAVLILISSQADSLLPTTLSRCQQVTFQLSGTEAIEAHLKGLGVEAAGAASLAALSGGRVGWAVAAAQQPAVLAVRRRLLDLCARLPQYGLPQSLRLAEEIKQEARALAQARGGTGRVRGGELRGRRIRYRPRAAGRTALVSGRDGLVVSRSLGGGRGGRRRQSRLSGGGDRGTARGPPAWAGHRRTASRPAPARSGTRILT